MKQQWVIKWRKCRPLSDRKSESFLISNPLLTVVDIASGLRTALEKHYIDRNIMQNKRTIIVNYIHTWPEDINALCSHTYTHTCAYMHKYMHAMTTVATIWNVYNVLPPTALNSRHTQGWINVNFMCYLVYFKTSITQNFSYNSSCNVLFINFQWVKMWGANFPGTYCGY